MYGNAETHFKKMIQASDNDESATIPRSTQAPLEESGRKKTEIFRPSSPYFSRIFFEWPESYSTAK